jgi:hypothetical protein
MASTMKSRRTGPWITANYDHAVDVLYVTLNPHVASEGEGRPGGIELDFAISDGSACGVTVIGFRRNGWEQNGERLYGLIADHLNVSVGKVKSAILEAISPPSP